MARLIFSAEASRDIDDIAAFSLEQFGNDVADAYLTGLEVRCEQLREHPKMAALYPRLKSDIRCLIYRSHRIFYKIDNGSVVVLRILHHRRDEKRALR